MDYISTKDIFIRNVIDLSSRDRARGKTLILQRKLDEKDFKTKPFLLNNMTTILRFYHPTTDATFSVYLNERRYFNSLSYGLTGITMKEALMEEEKTIEDALKSGEDASKVAKYMATREAKLANIPQDKSLGK